MSATAGNEHGNVIFWLIFGAIAGWLAGKIMRGGGFGVVGNIVVGVVGAMIGGTLFGIIGLPPVSAGLADQRRGRCLRAALHREPRQEGLNLRPLQQTLAQPLQQRQARGVVRQRASRRCRSRISRLCALCQSRRQGRGLGRQA